MHYELYGVLRETEIMEAILEEIPIDVVEGFLQVKLECYKPLFPFRSLHEMNYFLQNNRVI